MRANLFVAPVEEILEDPRYFPVHLDLDRDCLTLIQTSRDRLFHTPFLDGRTPFAQGEAIEVSLSGALAARWARPTYPDRFIFHVAFCGSTLLATLLDVAGHSFAEREPNVLVNLADAHPSIAPARFTAALDLVRALLRRRWRTGEHSLCKPSNWANNLIPALTARPELITPLFIATDKRSYLDAVFRGGRPRMEYVVRATDHLLRATGTNPELWMRATTGVSDPLEVPARVALLLLHIQLQLFEDAMHRGGWARPQLLTLDEIEEDPDEACRVAANALNLEIPHDKLHDAISRRIGRYAKAPERPYYPEVMASENRRVEREYGRVMDRALDWAALLGLKNDCGTLLRRPRAKAS